MARDHRHRREIRLDGYVRDDGLIEVEAELTDVKTYAFDNHDRGTIAAGEAVHHMRVRIAVDDKLCVREAQAETLAGPYHICPKATAVFEQLVGLEIAPGWRRRVQAAIGGREGCTHITELMGPVATVVMQTYYGEASRKGRKVDGASNHEDEAPPPQAGLVNSCIGYHEDGEVARRLWPDGLPS